MHAIAFLLNMVFTDKIWIALDCLALFNNTLFSSGNLFPISPPPIPHKDLAVYTDFPIYVMNIYYRKTLRNFIPYIIEKIL